MNVRKNKRRREKCKKEIGASWRVSTNTTGKVLRRGRNLALSEDTCLEKRRMRSKVEVGFKRTEEMSGKADD